MIPHPIDIVGLVVEHIGTRRDPASIVVLGCEEGRVQLVGHEALALAELWPASTRPNDLRLREALLQLVTRKIGHAVRGTPVADIENQDDARSGLVLFELLPRVALLPDRVGNAGLIYRWQLETEFRLDLVGALWTALLLERANEAPRCWSRA